MIIVAPFQGPLRYACASLPQEELGTHALIGEKHITHSTQDCIAKQRVVKGRHFDHESVVLCVRWYSSFKLSYRALVAMIMERRIWSGTHDHFCGECSTTPQNSKNDGTARPALSAVHGDATRHM